ncbi:class I SAM-dependent methyltransferase [Streptomyces sp. NBC_01335]|uniref:class I SAM-dependent methyltransferase n=1 Tax=Streptomyces sp. NBC_01335 TaxID=2903828 RepID=UPI002E0F88AD|nr:class I SAM-dependent methyltransferase [Streptomyces sp. NBC_01335]
MTSSTTPFDEAERLRWAGLADAYAASFARLCARTVPDLLDAAGVGGGARVLDVGTGTGAVAVAACARGAVVTAVDAEPDMVKSATEAAPAADVHVALLPELPFADGEFDAVAANFVLNHVGRPRKALAELRRVTRPGGRIAVTIWGADAGIGQRLLGRAVAAAGALRPPEVPPLAPEEAFEQTPEGLAALLAGAGLTDVSCTPLAWDHRATVEEWWSGAATGVAAIGRIVTAQTPATVAEIKRHYEALSAEFVLPGGEDEKLLVLPHRALLASGRVSG